MAMAHKYLVNSIHCITTFQRVYRGHNQKSKYRSQRFTLIRIQAMVRLKKQHLVYTKKKKGAIVLQAAMRRTMAREWYLKAVYSALFLQKVARGAVCRRKFQLIQNSVCDLQALVRGRYHRLQYAKIRCNLVTLQRYGRGMVVSLRFARFKASSTIIQRFWRQWLWKRKQDCAVLLIQSVWRGYVEQMRLAESLSNKLIFIQACWRAAIVRTKYMTYRSSASMIQSSIRGYLVREEVRHKMLAVISVQRIWRGNRERELFQKNLEEKIKAATLLQGIWRMHKAYQYVITSKQRVTILQSFARQRLAARKIQYQVTSATKLQTAWRLLRVKRLLVVKRQQHQACVRIQTQRRMIKEFATFRLAREAAISIQSRFRGYSARLFTKRHLYSVAIIQSGWRSAQAREYYLCARVSVAMMQSLGRGVLARRKFTMLVESKQEERHLAATCIQAVWRMKQSREVFESTLNAAICIQKYWRCANAREYHLHARAAVTMVQSLIRGVAVRSIVSDWHRSAICLQRYWRGHYSYEEYRMRVESKLREAEVSQSQNGSFEQTTKAGPVYKSKRIPSIRVGYDQAEGDHVKRESALLLSENQTQQSQPFSPSALEVLQSLLHNSATQIQRVWRGSVARRMVISDRLVTSSSAIVAIILIQATWRGSLHRNKFTERRACAITIQALFRMTRELKMFWYVRLPTQQRITLDDAARKIQVAFFLWKMKLAVWQMQSNAIILQRCIRGQLVRSAARFALVHMNASIKNAAVLSFARLVAGNDPYFATTAVASDRAVSNAQISACIVIQSAARRMLAKRAVFFEHGIKFGSERCIDQTIIIEKDPSAAIIQTAFRVTRACHEMGSGKIQAAYRGLKARQSYLQRDEHSSFLSMQLLNASIQDQRIARGKLAQVEAGNRLLKLHKREKSMTDAVVVIQKIARGVFGRVEASRHQVAREKAQAVANTLARTKAVRCLYAANEREKALTNAAVLIQKRIRQILAKRDRRRKQNIAIEKSLQVHSMLLRRIEKSSKDAVEKLLTTSGVSSNVDVIPCIRRLANRVIIARQEAAKHSKEGMTEYASEIMQGSGFEEIKHFSSSNSVASVHDSDLSSHQQIIEKKPSTPKIGNLATPVRSNRAIFEEAPNITLGQLMPTIGKKVGADHATSNNPDKLAQRTGLALQAKELLMFGRKNKGSLTAPAPKEVEITEEQTAMNEAEDRPPRGDNKSNKNLLFGAISPIKKERDSNGWDWAEEW
jgi:abnormal spindle-like microcephaly-associated protein